MEPGLNKAVELSEIQKEEQDLIKFCESDEFMEEDNEIKEHNQELGFIVLLVVAFLCSLLLYFYNKIEALHMFPESIAAIIVGLGIGIFFKFFYGKQGMVKFLEFEPHVFFLILLPPIMFQAGFCLNVSVFLKNIATINMYAIFATAIASFVFGILFFYGSQYTDVKFDFLNSLHFGCFISAIDPVATISIFSSLHVNEKIYMIVFGESTLNDAVAIALSQSVASINPSMGATEVPETKDAIMFAIGSFCLFFFGSCLLGAICSILVSYLYKNFEFSAFPWIEVGLFGMCSYLPYILAEYLELSGILAIFVTGIMLRDYTFYSLSPCGKITVEFFVETTGFISENFVFAYVGISIPLMMVNFDWKLVLIGCGALLVSRLFSVLFISLILNCFRSERIPFSHQIVMSYAGLRGAVAFYLALNVHHEYKHLVIMTTISLIMFTIIGLGSTTTCLLKCLDKTFPEDEILVVEEERRLEGDDKYQDQQNQAIDLLKQTGKYTADPEKQENEPRLVLPNQSEDSESYISNRSITYDKNYQEVEDFLNRKIRGGDMSPFRTKKLQFRASQRKKSGIEDEYHGEMKRGATMRHQARKMSHQIDKKRTQKNFETPKFAMTSKNKPTGSHSNTFGELMKSHSEDMKEVNFSPEKQDDRTLPKLNFNEFIIDEEQSGDDEESKRSGAGSSQIQEPKPDEDNTAKRENLKLPDVGGFSKSSAESNEEQPPKATFVSAVTFGGNDTKEKMVLGRFSKDKSKDSNRWSKSEDYIEESKDEYNDDENKKHEEKIAIEIEKRETKTGDRQQSAQPNEDREKLESQIFRQETLSPDIQPPKPISSAHKEFSFNKFK